MPFPVFDVQQCMKTSAERTDIVMRRIQELIHRNVTPKRQYHSQALRLQQVGILPLIFRFLICLLAFSVFLSVCLSVLTHRSDKANGE